MTSKTPVRSCEDVDETALSYAEIKALCAGDPRVKEKMELENDVARLRMLKSEYSSQHYRLEDDLIKTYPQQIASVTERIAGIEKDIALHAAEKEKCVEVQTTELGAVSVTTKFPGMTIDGVVYTEKEPAAKALLECCKNTTAAVDAPIGEYMGFKMSVSFDTFSKQFKLLLRGNITYQLELGSDSLGNITRINNALDGLDKRLEGQQLRLESLNDEVKAAKEELTKPFPQEQELADKELRLVLLNADLNIDGDSEISIIGDSEQRGDGGNPDLRGADYEYDNDEDDEVPQTGTLGKSPPTFLDSVRKFSVRKQARPPNDKPLNVEH